MLKEDRSGVLPRITLFFHIIQFKHKNSIQGGDIIEFNSKLIGRPESQEISIIPFHIHQKKYMK